MQERLSRQERKSQTRERLLDAAAQVFARRGFEAASLDEVAAAAGYTKGAVYSNFASKTALVIALIVRRIEVQTAEHARRFEGKDLAAMACELEGQLDQEPEAERQWVVLAVEFWLHAMRDEQAKLLLAEQYEHARTVTAEMIASIYENAGRSSPFAPRDLAIIIESLSVGLAFQAFLDPEHVRMSLQGEVLTRIMGLQVGSDQEAPSPVSVPVGE